MTNATLSRADSVGLTLTVGAGFISLTAVSMMFVVMFHNIYRQLRTNHSTFRLIQEPMDLYMLSLFLADMAQALGAILDIRWIHKGRVVEGTFCTAQGVVQQLGETGVVMSTLVIAIHALVVIWWRRGIHALGTAKIIMGIVWLYIVLFVAISVGVNGNKHYKTLTPYWCWIGSAFQVQRILGGYLWLWLTVLSSFMVYIALYFCSRGNIVVDEDVWWKFKIQPRQIPDPHHSHALGLIVYPLVYSILVLPLSVIRWHTLQHEDSFIQPAAIYTAVTLYGFIGAFNVALLLTTQPNLLLFKRNSLVTGQTTSTKATDVGQVFNDPQ